MSNQEKKENQSNDLGLLSNTWLNEFIDETFQLLNDKEEQDKLNQAKYKDVSETKNQ
ncbi:hypothetical protein [Bacillus sp. EB01]|uniref:hypothetical protein n=1 Tax=Bacillus sp. EB01 TaxID=1347086 RepID=UPI000AECA2C9|nr:hypothetical protein [Bacillus sp. EB01]